MEQIEANGEPLTPTVFGSEKDTIEILRRIEIRRSFNISQVNQINRDPAIVKLIQIGNKMYLPDNTIETAIKIFDFDYSQHPDITNTDLLTATSLLMAVKIDDIKYQDLCQIINSQFEGIDESDILKNELVLFRNLNYDIIFATPSQFLWHFLSQLYNEDKSNIDIISHYSRIISLCSQSSIDCYKFSGEEIAKESLELAKEIVEQKFAIPDLKSIQENPLKSFLIESLIAMNQLYENKLFETLLIPQTLTE